MLEPASRTVGGTAGAPIHAELRGRTALLHQELEQRLDLIGPGLSLDRYRWVLRTFHGWYAPVEAQLAPFADATPSREFTLRDRTALLARDLQACGAPAGAIAALPRCRDLPPLLTIEQRAGCLYVIEGAALGGQIITRALDRQLGLRDRGGSVFFAGDGEATGLRWRRVLAWLDDVARRSARSDDIIVSACETFSSLSRWVDQQGTSP